MILHDCNLAHRLNSQNQDQGTTVMVTFVLATLALVMIVQPPELLGNWAILDLFLTKKIQLLVFQLKS